MIDEAVDDDDVEIEYEDDADCDDLRVSDEEIDSGSEIELDSSEIKETSQSTNDEMADEKLLDEVGGLLTKVRKFVNLVNHSSIICETVFEWLKVKGKKEQRFIIDFHVR